MKETKSEKELLKELQEYALSDVEAHLSIINNEGQRNVSIRTALEILKVIELYKIRELIEKRSLIGRKKSIPRIFRSLKKD